MSQQEEWLTSVGIDVGTSTTKMIVSRLRIARMSSTFALPRYDIVERRIQYESPVITTPLQEDRIDAYRIGEWLQEQYRFAHLKPSEVQTGAVIFTGESAGKTNAQPILHQIAAASGAFVVATAGSDLEAVLAAKGSGAEAYSRDLKEVVVNVDIGGGTANAAYCYRGKVIHTVTYHVGGRLIRIEPSGRVLYVAEAIQPWLQANGFIIEQGSEVSYELLRALSWRLSRSLLSGLTDGGDLTAELLRVDRGRKAAAKPPRCTQLIVSGGIGQFYYSQDQHPRTLEEAARFGDIGPLLADTLHEVCGEARMVTFQPSHTVRATVLGAGMQSTEISGSTVYIEPDILPLRNVPIVQLSFPFTDRALCKLRLPAALRIAFEQAVELYHAPIGGVLQDSREDRVIGLAFTLPGTLSYTDFEFVAEQLVHQFRMSCPEVQTLVIVCEQDLAKALGQRLHLLCQGHPKLICIDQIRVVHGDYIDLGTPVSGTTIPVIVKTLVF